jgi:L-lactate dehydrogenase complex protein LldG
LSAFTDLTREEQLALFTERATPLGSVVEHVADSSGLAAIIADRCKTAGTTTVSISRPVEDAAPELLSALRSGGIEVDLVKSRDQARDKPVGITLASRAIAETGSVFLDERYIQDRAPSLMTLNNVVIVRVDDLVSSLDVVPELLREIAMRGPGGYGTFVTGPSRTADIEMSLTVGVQGPAKITMAFVDSLR